MSYSSSEFVVPNCGTERKRTLITYNNTLYVLAADRNGVRQTTFDLRRLAKSGGSFSGTDAIDTDALKNPSNWATTGLRPSSIWASAAATSDGITMFAAEALPSLFGPPMFKMLAVRYTVDPQTQQLAWGPDLQLLQPDGTPVPTGYSWAAHTSGVSATAFGQNHVIFACTSTAPADVAGRVLVYVYDTTKVSSAASTWTADSVVSIERDDLDAGGHAFAGMGGTVEIEWLMTVDPSGGGPVYLLALTCAPTALQGAEQQRLQVRLFLPITLVQNTDGSSSVTLTKSLSSGAYLEMGTGLESSLMRDPAGRLKSYVYTATAAMPDAHSRYFDTSRPPSPDNEGGALAVTTPLTIADPSVAPAGLMVIFEAGRTRTTVNGCETDEYPVLEFILSGGDTHCQVNEYGTIQVLQSVKTLNPDPVKPVDIISGIIDGPIPLPLENYVDTTLDRDSGTLTYGTSNTTTTERTAANAWTVGFESDGKTTAGIGPAWRISLDGGMGSVTGTDQTTRRSFALRQAAVYEAAKGDEAAKINPYGTVQRVSANFNVTAYRFLDATGAVVSDATTAVAQNAPKQAIVLTTLVEPSLGSYTPYSVVPGDLTSYTPDAWNSRMKSLGYSGDNYFGDVICANAYPFASQVQNYLSFTWTEDSTTLTTFSQFNSSYTENSWTLDASVYAGVSVGLGIDIFGLGEESEIEFLVGATYHHESTSTENRESEWGIDLEPAWGPPTSPNPKSVKHYQFRTYFLPVPTAPSKLTPSYWTKELIDHLDADADTPSTSIDASSCCWRIVHVVTDIHYRDPSIQPVTYDGHLDRPSVYDPNGQ